MKVSIPQLELLKKTTMRQRVEGALQGRTGDYLLYGIQRAPLIR
jgi:hypothetical protein